MRYIKMAQMSRWLLCAFIGLLAIVFTVDSGARFNLKMVLTSNDGKFLLIFLLTLITVLLVLTGRRAGNLTQSNHIMTHGDPPLEAQRLEETATNAGDEPKERSLDSFEHGASNMTERADRPARDD